MKLRIKKRYLILFGALVVFALRYEKPVKLGGGVKAPDQPYQSEIKTPTPFEYAGFTFIPKAEFNLTAKILSKEYYYMGHESKLSPVDLALGWGEMSDEHFIKDIKISQGFRWYTYRSKTNAISNQQIGHQSSNMHMIPASDTVKTQLKKCREGQIISLQGQLVNIKRADGWRWNSSLSRTDTGGGACEIIWVKQFKIVTGK